ncbi:MAG: Imm26 family immunity protein [Candidatus Gracilibacteria bacterium]|nr:Imm26 family immunity protein [Candidatus Gracilibacteria bacterium]
MTEQIERDLLCIGSPSRKKTNVGDIFVVSPKEGMYLYGIVAKKAIIDSDTPFNLIYIYNYVSDAIKIPEVLSSKDLLIEPRIVNNLGWSRGYFKTIGNIPVEQIDLLEDHGFYDDIKTWRRYFDEFGQEMDHVPKNTSEYTLGNYLTTGDRIFKALDKLGIKTQ